MEHDYAEIYKIDAEAEWLLGAYDEMGDQVYCDACHDELRWDPRSRTWRCKQCGNEKSRVAFFNYIGADPPGAKCISQCQENYPLCKRTCGWYKIKTSGPIV